MQSIFPSHFLALCRQIYDFARFFTPFSRCFYASAVVPPMQIPGILFIDIHLRWVTLPVSHMHVNRTLISYVLRWHPVPCDERQAQPLPRPLRFNSDHPCSTFSDISGTTIMATKAFNIQPLRELINTRVLCNLVRREIEIIFSHNVQHSTLTKINQYTRSMLPGATSYHIHLQTFINSIN